MKIFHRHYLLVSAIFVSAIAPALADDANQAWPLQGSVQHQDVLDEAPSSFRLTRTTPREAHLDKHDSALLRGFSGAQNTALPGQLMQQRGLDPLRALTPKSAPLQGLARMLGERAGLLNVSAGEGHWTPANPEAPYIWCQSIMGGYYDSSGTCKTTVWGDRLREYGGKFQDGTPVPIEMVTVNSRGHVWYQSNLSKSGFLNRKDFPRNGIGL